VNTAYEAMQAARKRFETEEAIKEYAESLYLTTGSGEENIVDPDTRLTYAQNQLERANSLFEGLRDLFAGNTERPDATRTNSTVDAAFNEYEKRYTDYLWLAEAAGLLSDAVDEQKDVVEECKEDVERDFAKLSVTSFFDSDLYSDDPDVINYFTEKNGEYDFTRDIDGRTLEEWLSYFSLPEEEQSGLGVIMYDSGGGQGFNAEQANDYLANRFKEDFKEWIRQIGNIYNSSPEEADDMAGRWSRWQQAYLYLMAQELTGGNAIQYKQECQYGGCQDVYYVNPKVYRDFDRFKELAVPYDYIDTDDTYYYLRDMIMDGPEALATINANPEEKELFNFFMFAGKIGAFNKTGALNEKLYKKKHQVLIWKWYTYPKYTEFNWSNFTNMGEKMDILDSEQAILDTLLGQDDMVVTEDNVGLS